MELIPLIAVYTAVYTFFGVLINDMAKKRNRHQAAWVILSLLSAPLFGVILLLLVGKNEESEESAA